MLSKKILVVAVLVLVGVAAGAMWFVIGRRRAVRLARFSAESAAVVTRVDFTRYRTGAVMRDRIDTVVDARAGKHRRTTHVRYSYVADGREIESEIFRRGDHKADYPVGMRAKACYDPRHPEESILVAPDERCGG